jgi:hypothetical protein
MEAQAQQAQEAAVPRIAEESEESSLREARSEASEARQQQVEHPEFEALNQKLQKAMDAKVEQVRADRRLTRPEQRQQITDIWNRVSEYHATTFKAHEELLADRAAEQERAVFYVSGAQQDSVRAAYNDVYDRTGGFSSGDAEGVKHAREELERFWERAVRTGDKALSDAVGHIAVERGIEGLRDGWLATSQERTEAWGRYAEARTKLAHWQDPQVRMMGHLTGRWSLAKPPEA